jgi:hypothetical protein
MFWVSQLGIVKELVVQPPVSCARTKLVVAGRARIAHRTAVYETIVIYICLFLVGILRISVLVERGIVLEQQLYMGGLIQCLNAPTRELPHIYTWLTRHAISSLRAAR